MDPPRLLNTARLPARIDSRQAAEVLGMSMTEISVLVAARLLRPLGVPGRNGPKFFAAVDVETLARDRIWLDRAHEEINRFWLRKNSSRRGENS